MRHYRKYEDILPLVEKPSRYLGQEINVIKKDLSGVELHVALAFPDLYEIGTSHFGLQILYHILNQQKEIYAERVFAPGLDMADQLNENRISLLSLETRTPLAQFDIVGFSLLYELNYTNVLLMMELAKIPFLSSKRNLSHPFVIAGGPCTSNPEPMAAFFDAMVIGDGEEVLLEISRSYMEWNRHGGREKTDLLNAWSQIEGVYVPSFFRARMDNNGFQTLIPEVSGHTKIKRAVVTDLDAAAFPISPILPCSRPVHDRLRLEVSRGCTRGCRFCQAGMIYRPVRERSFHHLFRIAEDCLAATGYEDLSLLSLSTGDYSCIVPLMEQLLNKQRMHPLAVSLPSIRAETLTPKLMDLIKRVRKTGFTIAPEAGTQRLRDVINKNISEKDIFDTVRDAMEMGWNGIKLYFMIGLPTETDEDLAGIVELVKTLRDIKVKNQRQYQITVSVATFIPKPHTPFQWASQLSFAEAKRKILWLKDKLNLSKVHFKWQNPEISILEGLWARGDRRLSQLLLTAYRSGCRFDGWSDQFNAGIWNDAIRKTGINSDEFTLRRRSTEESLPWDHIDIGVSKDYFQHEWEKALLRQSTPDCRWGDCSGCGVCDFKAVLPRICSAEEPSPVEPEKICVGGEKSFKKLKVTYSKTGSARFLGHLEMVNVFIRAIRRAGLFVKYSEGYHPKVKISFADPLPVGVESQNETMVLTTSQEVKPDHVLTALKGRLPEGIVLRNCEIGSTRKEKKSMEPLFYRVTLTEGCFQEEALKPFLASRTVDMVRTNKKGKEFTIDLKKAVASIHLTSPRTLELGLISQKGKTIRPADILLGVFGIAGDELRCARILKY